MRMIHRGTDRGLGMVVKGVEHTTGCVVVRCSSRDTARVGVLVMGVDAMLDAYSEVWYGLHPWSVALAGDESVNPRNGVRSGGLC